MSTVEQAPLSSVERDRLLTEEEVIHHGWHTFINVGKALAAIRDQRLYREGYATFADYCQDRWNLGRSRAYQMIEAAGVSTNVDIANEAQARALSGLDPDEQRATYERAQQAAGEKPPTAAQIKAARPVPSGVGTPSGEDHPAPETAADPDTEDAATQERLDRYLNDNADAQLRRWRKNFMTAIKAATDVLTFNVHDVADNADEQLLDELDRAAHDLTDYAKRVREHRPRRLRALDGGNR